MPPPFPLRRDKIDKSRRARAHNAKQNIYNIKQRTKQGIATRAKTKREVNAVYKRFGRNQCAPRRNQNFVSKHYRKAPNSNRLLIIKGYCRQNPGNGSSGYINSYATKSRGPTSLKPNVKSMHKVFHLSSFSFSSLLNIF